MNFYDFLSSYSKVETTIGLAAFIIASVLGYFAYQSSMKLKRIGEIVSKADTQTKAELAGSLMQVLPTYKIPDLSEKHGFEIVKIQLAQRSEEFKNKNRLIRLGIILFSLVVVIILGKPLFHYESNSSSGDYSPVGVKDSAKVTYITNLNDTVK